jgi:FdhE protein
MVRFDGPALRDLFEALVRAARAGSRASSQLGALADAARDDPVLLERLAETAAFPAHHSPMQEMADSLGVSAPALRLVGRLLASPYLVEARLRRGPVPELDARSLEGPEACRCPACGSPPSLAVLCGDDGRRRLICGLCGEAWMAPRLCCAACGIRDPTRLGTLAAGADDARWAETCDGCRRYLKTVDQRRLPEGYAITRHAEEAASLFLDVMAEDAGFLRPDYHPLSHLGITT